MSYTNTSLNKHQQKIMTNVRATNNLGMYSSKYKELYERSPCTLLVEGLSLIWDDDVYFWNKLEGVF